ncbi:hypothetical protein EV359DRAFT_68136 [Lentinula novae-zelandiae]|nr:hypothetical protein EV359DRAFT_68136 [Lentinula novae-zelandiae]
MALNYNTQTEDLSSQQEQPPPYSFEPPIQTSPLRRVIMNSMEYENIHPRTCAIHRLVDDLLRLIFIECLPTIPISDPRFPTIFMQSHPLNVLTNVCTQWGELAVGTSELWRDIRIDFVDCDVDYKAGFWNELGKGILGFWFDQSAAHMLHVELIIEEPNYADHHWGDPKHQNLDISFPRCMRSFYDAFSMLPWARLHHLGLRGVGITPTQVLALRDCTKLHSLVLTNIYSWDPNLDHSLPPKSSIILPDLYQLTTSLGVSDHWEYLEYLHAENLIDLTLHLMARVHVDELLSSFLSFCQKSHCRLEHLTLVYAWTPTADNVREIFRTLPTLKSFNAIEGSESEAKWGEPFLNEDVFVSLIWEPQWGPVLLPLLQTFTGNRMDINAFDVAMAFMESRVNQGLKKVSFDIEAGDSYKDVRERLEKLKMLGLDVSGIGLTR